MKKSARQMRERVEGDRRAVTVSNAEESKPLLYFFDICSFPRLYNSRYLILPVPTAIRNISLDTSIIFNIMFFLRVSFH